MGALTNRQVKDLQVVLFALQTENEELFPLAIQKVRSFLDPTSVDAVAKSTLEKDVSLFIDRLCERIETNAAGLSKKLGYSRQTVTNWRNDNKIPSSSYLRLNKVLGEEIVQSVLDEMGVEK